MEYLSNYRIVYFEHPKYGLVRRWAIDEWEIQRSRGWKVASDTIYRELEAEYKRLLKKGETPDGDDI